MHTFDAPVTEIWSLIPTLDLESDKSRCLNHRDELDRAVQLPSRVVDGMLYIAQGSYNYIWDYVSQAAILVRESSMQFIIIYSLDTCR